MNRTLPVLAIVASVAALLVALLRDPSPEPAPFVPPLATPTAALSDSDLEEELAERDQKISALEWTVTHLVNRVVALEKAQTAGATAPGTAAARPGNERQQLESLRSDVDALLTGEAIETESGRTRLKELVGEIQNEVFAERVRERTAAREAATNERIARFAQEARLSPSQEDEVRKLLDAEAKKRQELQTNRGGGDRRQAFQQMRALSEETNEQAKSLLSADQFSQFEEMRQEDRHGGRANRADRVNRGDPSNRGDRSNPGDRTNRGDRAGGRRTQRGE
ncbi:MAG TPA: hypothetical protein DFS52_04080 [Myxococcales bacterium]|nr:hypothetical protein [Myxococcales bacterium]